MGTVASATALLSGGVGFHLVFWEIFVFALLKAF